MRIGAATYIKRLGRALLRAQMQARLCALLREKGTYIYIYVLVHMSKNLSIYVLKENRRCNMYKTIGARFSVH